MSERSSATERLLRGLSRLVPAGHRGDWVKEWDAEFAHAAPGAAARFRRLLNAAEDAVRLGLRRAVPGADGGRLDGLFQDAFWSFRALRRRPGYAASAIAALAIAIGANTAIFSVVSGVLLQGLPYRDAEGLVLVWADGSARGLGTIAGSPPADILDWRREIDALESIAALINTSRGFTDLEEPVVPLTHAVTGNYFEVLGVEAQLGRTITPADEDGSRVAVVSHGLWRNALGADPAIVGRTVRLDDEEWQIVGVLRPDFYSVHQLPTQPDLWIPFDLAQAADDRTDRRFAVYGRLAPEATVADARQQLLAVTARLELERPETHRGWSVSVLSLGEQIVGTFRTTFVLLLVAVGLVLAVACANVANLGLAQTASRGREIAVRAALGAPAGRLRRQLAIEGLMLGLAAGALGTLLAAAALPGLVHMIPGADGSVTVTGSGVVPFLDRVVIDWRVLGFSLAVSLLAGVAAGLLPGRQARRPDLETTLRASTRSVAGGAGRARAALVVLEVAVAVLLVAGAGLLLASFQNLQRLRVGFDAERVLTMRNSLRGEEFNDPASWREWFDGAVRNLEAMPEVERAAVVSFVPPEFFNSAVPFAITGSDFDPANLPSVLTRIVSPGYFDTLGIPLLRGRLIEERDDQHAAYVAVVNEEFQRRYLADAEPIGSRIAPDLSGVSRRQVDASSDLEIVGVVGNVRSAGADPAPHPIMYLSFAQSPRPIMNLVMRSGGDLDALARRAERTLWGLSRSINLYNVESLADRLGNLQWQARLSLNLLLVFGTVVLVLGAAGIYATLAYSVAGRVREMGIRQAMGAESGSVRRLVVGEGLRLAAAGIVLGTLGSVLLGRLLAGMLYQVAPGDPLVLATTATLLTLVAGSACWLPALRASRVDPAQALRPD